MITNKIRVSRAVKEFTQEDLASACKVARQTISLIEKGSIPSLLLAYKIAKALEMSITEVFIYEEEQEGEMEC